MSSFVASIDGLVNKYPAYKIGAGVACVVVLISWLSSVVTNDPDFSDLTAYIQQVKSRPKGKIEHLPSVKTIDPFIFNPKASRDPFKPFQQYSVDNKNEAVSSGLRPDMHRKKEALEAFPVDTLKMVGTVKRSNSLWALIKANDNTIYRVTIGNYMGRNYGKIINISANLIEIKELVSDKQVGWREQSVQLALTE
ncbi:MAG: pilus assembly protein PilP [Methylovulum sp.]